jgi:hypothetical protein
MSLGFEFCCDNKNKLIEQFLIYFCIDSSQVANFQIRVKAAYYMLPTIT